MEEYYIKYFKKDENDGICKADGCNNKTIFISLGLGYRKCCSNECYFKTNTEKRELHKDELNNNGPHVCIICRKEFKNIIAFNAHFSGLHKEEHLKISEIEKIKYDLERPIICSICGSRSKDLRLLEVHVGKFHSTDNKKESIKDYYDKYLKKENDGICKICEKETKFISLKHGYKKFCCSECELSDLDEQKRRYGLRKERNEKKKLECPLDENHSKLIKKPILIKSKIEEKVERPFLCEMCNNSYINMRDLATHISRSHKNEISLKDYYDICFKKDDEGKCKTCGKETNFVSIVRGYLKYCCHECFTSNKEANENKTVKRLKTMRDPNYDINKLKKDKTLKIAEDNKEFKCEICNKKFKDGKGLGIHLTRHHYNGDRNRTEEYYIKYFLKNENDGKCKICGTKTKFVSLTIGYLTYCSNECVCKDPETKYKKEQTSLKNYGTTHYSKTKEHMEYMKNGGAVYMLSFNTTQSKPQMELYKKVKEIYEDTYINFPILNYCADMAVLSIKLIIEYNGCYWHNGKEEYDENRNKRISDLGWKVLVYTSDEQGRDIIPPIEQIKNDINGILIT